MSEAMSDGVDRLSLLPDDLIHRIFSFILSTKQLIQVSILSKRFRHLWAHHPNLHFFVPLNTPVRSIFNSYLLPTNRCLLSYALPFIRSFGLSVVEEDVAYQWLRFASAKSVQNLTISVLYNSRIPRSIFFCTTLTSLTIQSGRFRNAPHNFPGFRDLKILRLRLVSISDDMLFGLLNSCPDLESLELDACDGYTCVEARLPCLLSLVVVSTCRGLKLSVDAPNVKLVRLGGELMNLDWNGTWDSLTKAKVCIEGVTSEFEWIKNLNVVANVSMLDVHSSFFKEFVFGNLCSKNSMLKNLKELTCHFNRITSRTLFGFTNCLGECPSLEKLFINLNYDYEKESERKINCCLKNVQDNHHSKQDIGEPSNHHSKLLYSLHHLKIITVRWFHGTKNELRLCKFLLEKALVLEKLVVHDQIKRGEQELQEVFSKITPASSNAHVIFR